VNVVVCGAGSLDSLIAARLEEIGSEVLPLAVGRRMAHLHERAIVAAIARRQRRYFTQLSKNESFVLRK